MKYALVYLLYQLLLRICADFEDERQVFLYSVTAFIFSKKKLKKRKAGVSLQRNHLDFFKKHLGQNSQKPVASIFLVQ
jgi:hypothetical protein